MAPLYDRVNAMYVNDVLFGGAGIDVMYGGVGHDRLDGGGGNDRVYGETGNDVLLGRAGNDYLHGGIGNDYLLGGAGRDVLVGGDGWDRFDFNSRTESLATNPDVIADFCRGYDLIDLQTIDADPDAANGNQSFIYISERSFSGRCGELRFASGVVQGDTNGDRIADFAIKLSNITALAATDFIL